MCVCVCVCLSVCLLAATPDNKKNTCRVKQRKTSLKVVSNDKRIGLIRFKWPCVLLLFFLFVGLRPHKESLIAPFFRRAHHSAGSDTPKPNFGHKTSPVNQTTTAGIPSCKVPPSHSLNSHTPQQMELWECSRRE